MSEQSRETYSGRNPFLRVIEALNQHQVRYVVVGGFAAVMHGSDRATRDLDIIVDLRPEEARKAIAAMLSIGFICRVPVDPFLFAEAEHRDRWMREKNAVVFTMVDPTSPIFVVDLFIQHPMEFEPMFARARLLSIHRMPCRVCNIDDLIALKRMAGRPKDLLDIETLETIKSKGLDYT